jgi:hypothetical protein
VNVWGKTRGIGFASTLAIVGLLAALAAAPASAAPTWLGTTNLSGQEGFFPLVAMDPPGGAVAVWDRFNGTNLIVEASSRPIGSAFSAPVPLSAGGQDAETPQVATDTAGDAVAVWKRFNGTKLDRRSGKPPGRRQLERPRAALGRRAGR